MNSFIPYSGLVALALGFHASVFAEAPKATKSPSTEVTASVLRGDHLVNRVAMCADCHTPRLQNGQLDPAKALHGSTLGFAPTVPMPWMPVAPAIAGLPGYTDEQAITLLTTGKKPNGQESLPPMPSFRFSEQEAKDVVAYLKSLKAPGAE